MNFRQIALALALTSAANAFAPQPSFTRSVALNVGGIGGPELTPDSIMKSVSHEKDILCWSSHAVTEIIA
jgi:hypothetical protein